MLQFNEKRSTQAAAEFLKRTGGNLNYMVLIKFLYLLDREALLRWGTPITGDSYRSMRWGPLLSHTHDLITEEAPEEEAAASYWRRHIDRNYYDVVLRADPGSDELSIADEKLITRIFEEFYPKFQELKSNPFSFCEYLHTILPEYRKAGQGESLPLDHHDILVAGNKRPDEIMEVETLLSSVGQMRRLK